jgi:hypothetical protein
MKRHSKVTVEKAELCAELLQLPERFCTRRLQILLCRYVQGLVGLLLQVANVQALGFNQIPGIQGNLIDDDFKQRGFASAVGPDDADVLAFVDGEARVIKKNFCAVLFVAIIQLQ